MQGWVRRLVQYSISCILYMYTYIYMYTTIYYSTNAIVVCIVHYATTTCTTAAASAAAAAATMAGVAEAMTLAMNIAKATFKFRTRDARTKNMLQRSYTIYGA